MLIPTNDCTLICGICTCIHTNTNVYNIFAELLRGECFIRRQRSPKDGDHHADSGLQLNCDDATLIFWQWGYFKVVKLWILSFVSCRVNKPDPPPPTTRMIIIYTMYRIYHSEGLAFNDRPPTFHLRLEEEKQTFWQWPTSCKLMCAVLNQVFIYFTVTCL